MVEGRDGGEPPLEDWVEECQTIHRDHEWLQHHHIRSTSLERSETSTFFPYITRVSTSFEKDFHHRVHTSVAVLARTTEFLQLEVVN